MGADGGEEAESTQLKAMSHPGSRIPSLTKTHRHQRDEGAVCKHSSPDSTTSSTINQPSELTHPGRGGANPNPAQDLPVALPSGTVGKSNALWPRWSSGENQQVQPGGPTNIWSRLLHTWVLDTLWKAYLDAHFQGRSAATN